MSKNTFITAISIFVLQQISVAQIPELDVRNNNLKAETGIEKARLAYDKGEYLTAEALLYSELEKGNFTPNDFLLFANTLNVDNKPALAKEFYNEYVKESGNKNAESLIQKVFSTPSTTSVQNNIVTKYPVTNPTSYGAKLHTAIDGRMMSYNKSCDGDLSNRSEILDGILDSPLGSITFFDNGEKAVASVIDQNKNTSKLYLFYKKKGKWRKPAQLFAGTAGNFAFPFIDEENKTLYFSSDKAGSLGGYDIYKSVYSDKNFESSINLGADINSAGNDVNPTMVQDWLYFSSNGHVSKGGYDIYKYKKISENNALLLNATDLNTAKNELAVVDNGARSILVNRVDKDLNELVSISKPAVVSTVTGNVIDEAGQPIVNAYVLLQTGGEQGEFAQTDKNGRYVFKSALNFDNIAGTVMADGYESKTFNTAKGENASVQLIKIKPVEVIKEVVKTTPAVNYSTIQPVPQTIETNGAESIKNSTLQEVLISENVDESMTSSSRPDRGLYYIIIGSTYDYAQAYDFWTTWLPSFNGAEILEYGNGLYRIGFYAGSDENQAVSTYNEARKKKKDVWILRPKN